MQDVPLLSVRRSWRPALSVVVPAFNEAAGLERFHQRLVRSLIGVGSWEVVYVNDGSTDTTLEVIETLHCCDDRVAVVSLTRNFGKETAVTAGLDHAVGDAVVVIDADLQDPPEVIVELVARLAGWLRHGLRQAAHAGGQIVAEARNGQAVLPTDAPHGRSENPRGYRRFPPHEPARGRGGVPVARAAPLHEGAVRLGRLSDHLRAVRPRRHGAPASANGRTGSCGTWRSRGSPALPSCR